MHYVTAKGILSSHNGMNIYRGCQHGCIYCDARSDCYQMNHLFEDIEVKENALQLLERALKTKRKPCMIGFGAMSDPYIPLEQELRMTRGRPEGRARQPSEARAGARRRSGPRRGAGRAAPKRTRAGAGAPAQQRTRSGQKAAATGGGTNARRRRRAQPLGSGRKPGGAGEPPEALRRGGQGPRPRAPVLLTRPLLLDTRTLFSHDPVTDVCPH